MKQFWKYLGISAAYFVSFLGIQLWVTVAAVLLFMADLVRKQGLSMLRDPEIFASAYLAHMNRSLTGVLLVTSILTIAIMWGFFCARRKNFCREIGLQKTSGRNLLLSVLFGIGMCFLVSVVMDLLPIPDTLMLEFENRHGMLWQGGPVFTFLAVTLVGPVSEEICFRGLCYTRLKRGMRPVWAGLISAVFFGLAHGTPVWILVGLLSGMAMAWIFEVTGSLWTAILVHILNNAVSLITALLPMSRGLYWALASLGMVLLVFSILLVRQGNVEKTDPIAA